MNRAVAIPWPLAREVRNAECEVRDDKAEGRRQKAEGADPIDNLQLAIFNLQWNLPIRFMAPMRVRKQVAASHEPRNDGVAARSRRTIPLTLAGHYQQYLDFATAVGCAVGGPTESFELKIEHETGRTVFRTDS